METYGEISKAYKAIKLVRSLLKVKEGFVPIGVNMGLAKDLKKQGLTRG